METSVSDWRTFKDGSEGGFWKEVLDNRIEAEGPICNRQHNLWHNHGLPDDFHNISIWSTEMQSWSCFNCSKNEAWEPQSWYQRHVYWGARLSYTGAVKHTKVHWGICLTIKTCKWQVQPLEKKETSSGIEGKRRAVVGLRLTMRRTSGKYLFLYFVPAGETIHLSIHLHNSLKHRKNCECCPVSLLIVRSQWLSWIQVLNCLKCKQFHHFISLSWSMYLHLSLFEKLSFGWPGRVSSSLWSYVSKVTSLLDRSLKVFFIVFVFLFVNVFFMVRSCPIITMIICSSGLWAGLDPKHLPQELWHRFSASWESSICPKSHKSKGSLFECLF